MPKLLTLLLLSPHTQRVWRTLCVSKSIAAAAAAAVGAALCFYHNLPTFQSLALIFHGKRHACWGNCVNIDI